MENKSSLQTMSVYNKAGGSKVKHKVFECSKSASKNGSKSCGASLNIITSALTSAYILRRQKLDEIPSFGFGWTKVLRTRFRLPDFHLPLPVMEMRTWLRLLKLRPPPNRAQNQPKSTLHLLVGDFWIGAPQRNMWRCWETNQPIPCLQKNLNP